jgi:XK-related protein
LFSVCWALASFSKNVRLHNVHRLVLTWLGVIFQFLWRLGTVTARVTSLTVYATVYHQWVLLVIIMHWLTMFLWLIAPKSVFQGENISRPRKLVLSALVALVYVFCYINLQESKPRRKMAVFYVIMFLENALLVSMWLIGVHGLTLWYRDMVLMLIFSSFIIGKYTKQPTKF